MYRAPRLAEKERGNHGRTSIRSDFHRPPGHAGRRNQEGNLWHRAHLRRKGREDREDRALGYAQARLSRREAPRRYVRLSADPHQPRRPDRRTRTPPTRARRGHQVPNRTPGRRPQAPEEIRAQARSTSCAPSTPHASAAVGSATTAATASRGTRTGPDELGSGRVVWTLAVCIFP